MNDRHFLLVAFFMVFLFSCGESLGNRIDSRNLSVYYLNNVDKATAIEFAKYWRDNNYVGNETQFIQLDKKDNIYYIRLIEKEEYHQKPLSIEDQAKINELERTLAKSIFNKRVVIEITDNTFRPIDK